MFFIFLLPTFVTGTVVSETCFEFSRKSDLVVKKGEEMRFNCSIKPTGNCFRDYNVTDIVIRKGSIPVSTKFIVYHEAEKTVETKFPSATFADKGTYICGNNDTVLALLTVHVEEPPSVPEELRCLSRQWNDMICSFLMVKTESNTVPQWKMEFKRSQNWTTFPKSNCNNGNFTCWLNNRSNASPSPFNFFPMVSYQVRVVVWNLLGNATAKITIENTSSIVQPGPVESLKYNYTTASKNVSLQWKRANGRIKWMLDYKILISSEFDNRMLLITNRTAASEEYILEDLIPFLNYSVSVSARPSTAELDIYWSTATTVKFRTETAIPLHAVTMTPGSYVILDCGQQDMCIVIYWKNPEKRYRHGLITGYNVTIRKYCFEQTTSLVKTKPSCKHQDDLESSSEVLNGMAVYGPLQTKMLKDDSYFVKVMVRNSKGVSRNHTELIIPNWNTGQDYKPVLVVAELTNNSAFISWQMYPQFCSAVTAVTYYWCTEVVDGQLNSFYVSCKDGFDWKKLEITDGCGARNGHNIHGPINSPGSRYAVSVETDTVSGSLKWENFRFQKNNVPEKPLYRVSADGTVLKVHLQYRDYHQSESGKPDNYTMMYEECVTARDCASDVYSGTTKTFPVDFLNQDYIVDNLEPGTQYKVQVVASNEAGSSIRGKAVMVTLPEDLKVKIVEIVSGTLTGVISLALVLLCCLGNRWYRKTREKMTITVPAADDSDSGKLSSSLMEFRQGSINNQESLSSTTSTDLSSNLQNADKDSIENSQDMMGNTQTGNATILDLEILSQRDDKNVDHEEREIFINSDLGNSCPVSFSDMNPIMTYDMMDSTNVNAKCSCAYTTDTQETASTPCLLEHGNELSSKNPPTCKPIENTYILHDNEVKNKQLMTRQTSFNFGYVDEKHAIAVPHKNFTVDSVHVTAVSHANSTVDITVSNSAVGAVYDTAVPNANNTVDAVYDTAMSNPISTVNANQFIAVPHKNMKVAVDEDHNITVSHANSTVDEDHNITMSHANSTVDEDHNITVSHANSTVDEDHNITVSHANSTVDEDHNITVSHANSTVDEVHDITVSHANSTVDEDHNITVSHANSTVDEDHNITVSHANSTVDEDHNITVSHANSTVDEDHNITVSHANSTVDEDHNITVSHANSTVDEDHNITVSHANSTVDEVHDITVSHSGSTVHCLEMKKLKINQLSVGTEKGNNLFLNSSSTLDKDDNTPHNISENSYVVFENQRTSGVRMSS